MSARVQWQGLTEFRAALRALPDDLKDQAGEIVLKAATETHRDTQAAYPEGPTGNLKKGVRLNVETPSGFGARAVVRSTAKHAHLFEQGTRLRRTDRGANRGRMPQAPESQRMIPIAIRARRKMTTELVKLVEAQGLKVSQT